MRDASNIPWEQQYKEENFVGLAPYLQYLKQFQILEPLLELHLIEIFNSLWNKQTFAWEYLIQYNWTDLEKLQSGNRKGLLILLV